VTKQPLNRKEKTMTKIHDVADDMQMQWAIQDFIADLLSKGVSLEKVRKREIVSPRKVAEALLEPRKFLDAIGTNGCKASIQIVRVN
jgi:hypothetical protein